jgi:hypothetical protein
MAIQYVASQQLAIWIWKLNIIIDLGHMTASFPTALDISFVFGYTTFAGMS